MTTLRQLFTYRIGEQKVECSDQRLWKEAGFEIGVDGSTRDVGPFTYRRIARAISEGFLGDKALMRVIALGEEESHLSRAKELSRSQEGGPGPQVFRSRDLTTPPSKPR